MTRNQKLIAGIVGAGIINLLIFTSMVAAITSPSPDPTEPEATSTTTPASPDPSERSAPSPHPVPVLIAFGPARLGAVCAASA